MFFAQLSRMFSWTLLATSSGGHTLVECEASIGTEWKINKSDLGNELREVM